MEFTGDYYKCKYCGHMWDYMDICPNCGEDKMNTLNAHEVKEEANRLLKMLEAHGDYSPNEAKATLPINSVSVSCVDFATWMQDNYSPTLKDGRPLPKGNMRLDFTEDIYTISEIYEKYNSR